MLEEQNSTQTIAELNHDKLQQIATAANSIKHIHSFMLMSVNRCIDYSKAVTGVILEPNLSTFNLQDIVNNPVTCMNDLQTQIKVNLTPISRNL